MIGTYYLVVRIYQHSFLNMKSKIISLWQTFFFKFGFEKDSLAHIIPTKVKSTSINLVSERFQLLFLMYPQGGEDYLISNYTTKRGSISTNVITEETEVEKSLSSTIPSKTASQRHFEGIQCIIYVLRQQLHQHANPWTWYIDTHTTQ